jgi:hypothetical protein
MNGVDGQVEKQLLTASLLAQASGPLTVFMQICPMAQLTPLQSCPKQLSGYVPP